MTEEELLLENEASAVFVWAVVITILGLLAAVGAWFLPTTAPYSETLNLGLLQRQQMVFHGGLALVLVGSIMFATDAVIAAIKTIT